jgi:hypothetical protein
MQTDYKYKTVGRWGFLDYLRETRGNGLGETNLPVKSTNQQYINKITNKFTKSIKK